VTAVGPAGGPRVLVVQHEPSTGPGRFGEWLTDAGTELDICHAYAGDALPVSVSAAGADAMLVLGGAMGPADDEQCPWLPATRDLLAAAVSEGVPTFGICLGAELLAVACGGEVRRGIAGPELGVLPVEPGPEARTDAVFAVLPATTRVVQWHWEEISRLPAGAVPLASSPAYPNQAFRLGASAWGVQGHPEVTSEIAAAWAREDSPLLLAAGRRPDELVAEIRDAEAGLGAVWRPVVDEFARVVHASYAARPR
jgi:GMP synthase-like glutamine amidotransferase